MLFEENYIKIYCLKGKDSGEIMKLFTAIAEKFSKKDKTSLERYNYNNIRASIENMCGKYLVNAGDILVFEVNPELLDATIDCLEGTKFQDKYEFAQVEETLFSVRLREIELEM